MIAVIPIQTQISYKVRTSFWNSQIRSKSKDWRLKYIQRTWERENQMVKTWTI
jgi:hypothetical protein